MDPEDFLAALNFVINQNPSRLNYGIVQVKFNGAGNRGHELLAGLAIGEGPVSLTREDMIALYARQRIIPERIDTHVYEVWGLRMVSPDILEEIAPYVEWVR